jgi:redox-sensing transcriptional repressor
MNSETKVQLTLSQQAIRRLPYYLKYLKNLDCDGNKHISAAAIAAYLKFYEGLVRKDLAFVSSVSGKPRIGFKVDELIADIEHFLGYDCVDRAILVGAGHLGKALMCYKGFGDYGLEIVAAFDVDKDLIGKNVNGKEIFPLDRLGALRQALNARIGIITVPAHAAQEVCGLLTGSGVMAVWNFAPAHLNVPDNILIQNENMAESLAVLTKYLTAKR